MLLPDRFGPAAACLQLHLAAPPRVLATSCVFAADHVWLPMCRTRWRRSPSLISQQPEAPTPPAHPEQIRGSTGT